MLDFVGSQSTQWHRPYGWRRFAALMMPSEPTEPDIWAASNRTYPATAAVPGPRDPLLTPYVVEPERVIASRIFKRVVMVFVDPCPIAHVDITAAERAFPEVLGLAQDGPLTCLPMMVPRGLGSSIFMIAVMGTSQNNQAPELLPRPDLYGARCTSDRAAI
jgi:hypothetical protein